MGLMTRDHRYSTRPRTAHAVSSFGTRFTDNNSLPQRSSILMSALTNKRITCGVDRIRKLVWASVSAMQWIAWKLLYHWVLSGRYPSLDQFKSATSATVEWCLDKKCLAIQSTDPGLTQNEPLCRPMSHPRFTLRLRSVGKS